MSAEPVILVFAGPSLPPQARPAHPAIGWRGPARAGDALKVLEAGGTDTFVLIDGLFDGVPAIRHKELLALIAAGVRVIGGASMGALRASELHAYGMQGVGRIFDAYANGRLTGDDEVALLHGPAEVEWNALTEPLVNVRATLARAVRQRVLPADAARRLLDRARRTHFAERTWEGLTGAEPAFEAWLPDNRVDLKRLDALACVAEALEPRRAPIALAAPPPYTLFTAALAESLRQAPALDSI